MPQGRARPSPAVDGGFTSIEPTAHYVFFGTPDAVHSFGQARAQDCAEPWFVSRSLAHQLFTEDELRHTQHAWDEWSRSPDSFLAFAWCRVVGRKPGGCLTGDQPRQDSGAL